MRALDVLSQPVLDVHQQHRNTISHHKITKGIDDADAGGVGKEASKNVADDSDVPRYQKHRETDTDFLPVFLMAHHHPKIQDFGYYGESHDEIFTDEN